jgi:uncharacterized protein with von Willebrand factor type A (vWA) domain
VKRLLYDVSKWHLYLHRDARNLPAVADTDAPVRQLEDELFDVLYGGEGTPLAQEQQAPQHLAAWAEGLHGAFKALPTFERLARQCRGDADAAAVAVESLVEQLQPKLPEAPALPEASALRRAAARASTEALQAVAEAQELASGLAHVAGTGAEQGVPGNGEHAQRLLPRLRTDPRLRRVAELAGRFKRILAEKRRQRVRRGADEVADVEQGDTLARLLPSELARLTHPRARLAFLRDFTEKRCLQYRLAGVATLGRGPLVLCVDKSGSMDGPSDVWATAVALALLSQAQEEKRAFTLLCFSGEVTYEATVPPGDALPQEALFISCDGGTCIDAVLGRALDIIQGGDSRMKAADVVLVTDGISDDKAAPALRERAKALGVTVLGFGIGVAPEKLAPWCDQAQAISSVEMLEPAAAERLTST